MNLISVQEARKIIESNITLQPKLSIKSMESLGYYTVEDITAPIDVPQFDNSAMDGYCFAYESLGNGEPIYVKYTIQAGEKKLPVLKKNEAARIFTGAPIPKGADTVVMQEKTEVENQRLTILQSEVEKGLNIRLQGSQSQKGELILPRRTKITAGIAGFLAGFGIAEIKIYQKPKVGIIVTGKELKQAGEELQMGEIYESNSVTLYQALKEINITSQLIKVVDDDKMLLEKEISEALKQTDILLVTGGISVGDYDYVKEVLEKVGVNNLFYKIKQKPGKPLYFGENEEKYVFALPGNPASVFSCFHEYVKPFLLGMCGDLQPYKTNEGTLSHDYRKKKGLTHFLKAFVNNKTEVDLCQGQESYKMNTLVSTNCLVKLEEDKDYYKKGEKVEFILV